MVDKYHATTLPPGGRHTFVAKTVSDKRRTKSIDPNSLLQTTPLKSRKNEINRFSKAQLVIEKVDPIRSRLKYQYEPGHAFIKMLYNKDNGKMISINQKQFLD